MKSPTMNIDKLIVDCIKSGTSYAEKGKSVSIKKEHDELVLVFQTDNAVVRSVLGIARSCDVTFVYMRHRRRPILIFCELKGRNVDDAAEQVQSTLTAVRRAVKNIIAADFPQNGDIRALIVRTGSAPHNQGAIQDKFQRETGVRLQFARERADLRSYLG